VLRGARLQAAARSMVSRTKVGVPFADDPDQVSLVWFDFWPQEQFEYVYDFGDNWEHRSSSRKNPNVPPQVAVQEFNCASLEILVAPDI